MRDFTKLPSYREVKANKAKQQAIADAYANRAAWRPSAAVVLADSAGGSPAAKSAANEWVRHAASTWPTNVIGKTLQVIFHDGEAMEVIACGGDWTTTVREYRVIG